jgi:hypothetical protein
MVSLAERHVGAHWSQGLYGDKHKGSQAITAARNLRDGVSGGDFGNVLDLNSSGGRFDAVTLVQDRQASTFFIILWQTKSIF